MSDPPCPDRSNVARLDLFDQVGPAIEHRRDARHARSTQDPTGRGPCRDQAGQRLGKRKVVDRWELAGCGKDGVLQANANFAILQCS